MSLVCIVYTTGNDIDLRLLAFIYLQLFALRFPSVPRISAKSNRSLL